MIQNESTARGERDRQRLTARFTREVALDDRQQRRRIRRHFARLVKRRRHLRHVADGSERLRQPFQQRRVFTDQQHLHFERSLDVLHVCTNRLTRSSVTPASSTTFVRELAPATIVMLRSAIPKVSARSSTSAALAAPSTGGAVSLTLRASPWTPATRLSDARG